MERIQEGNLIFNFSDGWLVGKFDEWAFSKNFRKIMDGIKGLDFLAVGPDHTAWLIEVKDYRNYPRTKPLELSEEVAQKVLYTLAAMLPAKLAGDTSEKNLAQAVLKAKKLRVVLHLEQRKKPSKLFPAPFDPAIVKQKLRIKIKSIDAHPLVVQSTAMRNLGWTVQSGADV